MEKQPRSKTIIQQYREALGLDQQPLFLEVIF
jgi:hypothetical protein